ncbi:MAG TPA: ATP-binding protein [Candidatus Acidoferrales bacterium]|nr:ATP-binding protein [Candidatus Acidoferrales bacterium]
MEWHFRSADAAEALSQRRAFVTFLRARCRPESDFQAAEIVYGELVANVIRHAPGAIEIRLRSSPHGEITIEVYDSAGHFRIARPVEPPWHSENGRGLYIIWFLCGNVSRSKAPSGGKTSVVLPIVPIVRALDDGAQELRELGRSGTVE